MSITEAPLLEHWGLLQEQVVPRLDRGTEGAVRLDVWADGDMGDAVAVAVACHVAWPAGHLPLRVFVTADSGEPPAVHYSMSDIRLIPREARRETFRRGSPGWIPTDGVAEQVLLGAPRHPVDLLVVRNGCTSRRPTRPYSWTLRPGGHLLVVGERPPCVARDTGLKRVRGTDFLWRKEMDGLPPPHADQSALFVAEGAESELRTLAQKLLEDELISRHLNLARGLARRFSGHGEPAEDLRQVAFLALVLAAGRYDPSQNASFSTYATATVLGELKRYFRDKGWMMRVPRHVQETYLAVKTAKEELYQELACSPTMGQIAHRLRIPEEAVLEAVEAGDNFLPQSLDAGPEDDSPAREVPMVDPAFDVMLERNVLMTAIPRLSERQKLVLKRVYLDGWTQRRAAEEIGVSQMQVSRLLHASAQQLRSFAGS